MKYQKQQFGYSLVEVLVSISILLMATVGPMAIATQGLKTSQFALEQNIAYFLAQEGIELLFAVRNNYALADIDNDLSSGSDISWDWVNDINGILNNGPCNDALNRLTSNGQSCDIGAHFESGSPPEDSIVLVNCNNDPSNCDITLNESNNRAIYSHASGDETPFQRIVTITRETDFSIKVESVVVWNSRVFSTQQSVTETVYLFDSNFEL